MATPCFLKVSISSPSTTSTPFLCKSKRSIISQLSSVSSYLPSSLIIIHYTPKLSSNLIARSSPLSQSVSAIVESKQIDANNNEYSSSSSSSSTAKPCQVYVCNLPRDIGISELFDLFKPYGTVQSVEVSRNAETGMSRGCGYVTVSSIDEAKAAIGALDGSDVGGREMRVLFSAEDTITNTTTTTGTKKLEALNSKPKKIFVFESQYKVYAGNLAWSVKPEDLRNLFSQFGTVVSSRVLHDRKGGKNRVYGFLSFSSPAELKAAMSLNGTEYLGRKILLREVTKQNEP